MITTPSARSTTTDLGAPGQIVLPDLDQVAQLACHAAGTNAAMLVEWTLPLPTVLGMHGLAPTGTQDVLDFCLQAFAAPEGAVCVADIAAHERLSGHALASGPQQIRFFQSMALPLSPLQPAASLILLDVHGRSAALQPSDNLEVLTALASGLLGFIRHHEQLVRHGVHTESQSSSALRESESRLNLTEHTAGVGSWSLSLGSGRLVHSDEFASILGLEAGETVSTTDDMVARCNPEWRKGIRQRLERCAQNGQAFDEEIQVMVPGSAPKWVRAVGSAVRDPDGQILRIQGAMQDISAQKLAQQETTLLAMRLTTTLASITEAFVTLDRQCCFTYLNQESERLLQKTTCTVSPGATSH